MCSNEIIFVLFHSPLLCRPLRASLLRIGEASSYINQMPGLILFLPTSFHLEKKSSKCFPYYIHIARSNLFFINEELTYSPNPERKKERGRRGAGMDRTSHLKLKTQREVCLLFTRSMKLHTINAH